MHRSFVVFVSEVESAPFAYQKFAHLQPSFSRCIKKTSLTITVCMIDVDFILYQKLGYSNLTVASSPIKRILAISVLVIEIIGED